MSDLDLFTARSKRFIGGQMHVRATRDGEVIRVVQIIDLNSRGSFCICGAFWERDGDRWVFVKATVVHRSYPEPLLIPESGSYTMEPSEQGADHPSCFFLTFLPPGHEELLDLEHAVTTVDDLLENHEELTVELRLLGRFMIAVTANVEDEVRDLDLAQRIQLSWWNVSRMGSCQIVKTGNGKVRVSIWLKRFDDASHMSFPGRTEFGEADTFLEALQKITGGDILGVE